MFKLILVDLAVIFGTNFQFYSVTSMNNPHRILKQWINETVGETSETNSVLWTVTASSFFIGCVPGSVMIMLIADRLGRKRGLILSGAITALGGICQAVARTFGSLVLLILGRFLIGISAGLGGGLSALFLTEIAPTEFRGACGTSMTLAMFLGQIFGLVLTLPTTLGSVALWHWGLSAVPIMSSLFMCVVLLFVPESPKHLYLTLKKVDAAEKSLKFYQGEHRSNTTLNELKSEANKSIIMASKNSNDKNILSQSIPKETDRELTNIVKIVGNGKLANFVRNIYSYKDIPANNVALSLNPASVSWVELTTSRSYRKPLIVVLVGIGGLHVSGVFPIMTFSTDIFKQIGLSHSTANYVSIGLAVIPLLAQFPLLFAVERVGRRPLVLIGLYGIVGSLIVVMISSLASTAPALKTFPSVQAGLGHLTAACLFAFNLFFCIQAPVPLFLASELFDQRARAASTTLAHTLRFGLGAILVFTYFPFKIKVGVAWSFTPFVVGTLFCAIFLHIFLPETKGKQPHEISYKAMIPYWRRWKVQPAAASDAKTQQFELEKV